MPGLANIHLRVPFLLPVISYLEMALELKHLGLKKGLNSIALRSQTAFRVFEKWTCSYESLSEQLIRSTQWITLYLMDSIHYGRYRVYTKVIILKTFQFVK